ncbi:MAG: hypothetical protein DRN15_00720 [Thermoprotei archaeon]|nr:MAG: hypothetical protein DRN15_00720 [Thermoprotei archaeon]RLF25686.1 MAG: hypothetical protein DRM97_00965 [Thermoprotei archaeon]
MGLIVKPALLILSTSLIIWAILRFSRPRLREPSSLETLQHNILIALDRTSMETALLTVGLISIALALA